MNDVLIAGIGNLFLQDDGYGVAVADRLAGHPLPGVRVADFGIRGVHLAYELLNGYDTLVLVDAVPMGEPRHRYALIEPEVPAAGTDDRDRDDPDGDGGTVDPDEDVAPPVLDAHRMSPELVLATLAHLGGSLSRTLLVGCQPAALDEGMGLSPSVADAVDKGVALCLQVVAELLGLDATQRPGATPGPDAKEDSP